MKWTIFKVLVISVGLFINACNSTEPPVNNNNQDTTSHLINWLVDDIGDYGSYLMDVTIINDTLAYAVGEIHRNDTLYNLAKWNGTEWELRRIMFYTFCSQQQQDAYPTSSIFAFSKNDIFVGMQGSQIARLNDTTQIGTYCIPISVRKLWGTDSQNIYSVGVNGQIAHYNGIQWSSMESGTDVNLRDVWGSPDGNIIWIAGFEDSYGTVFLRNISNGFEKVLEITDPNMPHPPNEITHVFKSLWTDRADTVYLGAIGRVYAAPQNTTGYAKENIWWDYENETEFPPETNIIRGTAGNDIFVGGYLQSIRHWNGASWKVYPEIEGDGEWYGMAVKDNLIIAVGENFSNPGSAKIARGYRIK